MRDDELITLGGRKFRPIVQGSILHDEWVMSRVLRSGLGGAVPLAGESPEDFGKRVLAALTVSQLQREIFAGVCIPSALGDAEWTEEVAAETATFLGPLNSPEDKATLQVFILSTLVPFLESGFASRRSSAISSPASPGAGSSGTTYDPATTSANGAH
jgi:hypothetical protein